MVEKKQQGRYSDKELDLCKITFKDNDPLLKVIRKVMLQYPLTPIEVGIKKGLSSELLAVIRKTILPEIDIDAPIAQIGDLWFWLPFKLDDKDPINAYAFLQARDKIVKYFDNQLCELEGGVPNYDKIIFKGLINPQENPESLYTNLLVRNMILAHTEQQLQQFVNLAQLASMTVEELEKNKKKNSNR
jgi:hypothetical protein